MVENRWKNVHTKERMLEIGKRQFFENQNWHRWTMGPPGGHRFELGSRYHVEIKDIKSYDSLLESLPIITYGISMEGVGNN